MKRGNYDYCGLWNAWVPLQCAWQSKLYPEKKNSEIKEEGFDVAESALKNLELFTDHDKPRENAKVS
jgi:hypothetical protein